MSKKMKTMDGSGIHFLRVYGCRRDLSHHAVVPHGGTCG